MLNLIIDSINRRLIVYEKFDAIYQKTNQKVNIFKIYLKKIKKELFSFNKYHKAMLFLTKLISVLKNKLLIMRNLFNIKEIIFSCTRDNNDYNYFQSKNNKFFEHQLN